MGDREKESSSGIEKRGNSPSNGTTSTSARRATTGSSSTEKQTPNYLKPTISSLNEAARTIRKFRKTGPEETSQRPDPLRRRSFDRPPSAARIHKALTSPTREKPKTLSSTSFGSKKSTAAATAASKSVLVKVSKKPINAGKPQTLSSSSTKKGSGSSASKKHPSSTSHDRKEAQNLETKNHEKNEEISLDDDDHHHQKVEENVVIKDDHLETPKSEGNDEVSDVNVNITQEVKSVEQENDHIPADVIPSTTFSQEHNVHQTEEKMEDKFEEEKSHVHIQNDENKEEKHSKEGTMNEENIPDEEAKTETEVHEREGEEKQKEGDCATENMATSEEIGEEKQVEIPEKDDDEGRQEEEMVESSKEEIVEEAGQGEGIKESPTAYNDGIEETTSNLREEKKNKVSALVGAFEAAIDE